MVFMVPDCVGSGALFVNKVEGFFHLRDLCHPGHRNTCNRRNRVEDDQSRVGLLRKLRPDDKVHLGRSYFAQIQRSAKKIPGLFNADREK